MRDNQLHKSGERHFDAPITLISRQKIVGDDWLHIIYTLYGLRFLSRPSIGYGTLYYFENYDMYEKR